tara:strand:- start:278 stop:538 length:261 start_codon:yes stop_codon:yes gene_type:complete
MTIINLKTTPESIKEYNEDALLIDGFNDAIIGMCLQFGQLPVVAYDYEKCIQIIMKNMSRDDALEYFELNVINSYMGMNTPVFIVL